MTDNKKPKATDYIGLGYSTALAFVKKNPGLWELKDELMAVSAMGMVEGCQEFDSSKARSISCSTFIVHRCQQAMLNFVTRNEYRFGKLYKLEDMKPQADGEGDALSWQEIISGTVIDIPKMIAKLPEDIQRDVDIFMKGEGDRKARREMGYGNWSVYYERKKAVAEALCEVAAFES